jgi:SAM-dependent methyltransferase
MTTRRSFVFAVCAAPALLGATESDAGWKAFLEWYRTQPYAPPPEVLKRYRAHLVDTGVPEAAADAAVKRMLTSGFPPEAVGMNFDKIYALDDPPFEFHPSAFLRTAIGRVKPGAALDVSMGQGRNATYLARQGWTVTGIDISAHGLEVARENAAKAGVRIAAEQADFNTYDFGRERWDLIAMIFAWTPMHDVRFVQRIQAALKPGGLAVVEQFNGPHTDAANANALFNSFAKFRVLRYEDVNDVADWGKQEQPVGRIAAVREDHEGRTS